ncbi:MAG TPA: alpha/beta fold hydrolase, partial [Anaerolineaceae bacterium]|nr:alpha/beta fold hydrolase [Anaerolineaceae bacterium]
GVLAKSMPEHLTANPELAAQIRSMILKTDKNAVVASLKGMAEREDATGWLPGIRVPTLVVAGEEDKIVPLEDPQTFVRFIPRGWLVTAPGAGHLPMMEAPERVARGVKRLVQYAEGVQEHG